MSDAPPISEYELRIVDVLRRRSYERIVLGAVVEGSGVRKRLVRHHLRRLASRDVVEVVDGDNRVVPQSRYRWVGPDNHPYTVRLRAAARARGSDLAPLGERPTTCEEGHDLTAEGVGHVFPDGGIGCFVCGGGLGARPVAWRRSA